MGRWITIIIREICGISARNFKDKQMNVNFLKLHPLFQKLKWKKKSWCFQNENEQSFYIVSSTGPKVSFRMKSVNHFCSSEKTIPDYFIEFFQLFQNLQWVIQYQSFLLFWKSKMNGHFNRVFSTSLKVKMTNTKYFYSNNFKTNKMIKWSLCSCPMLDM